MEPSKDWTKSKSYASFPNFREFVIAIGGLGFFTLGALLLIRRLQSEERRERKNFLELMAALIGFSFFLFLPIANELNLRFFIVLVVLPYLFLALISEEFLHRCKTRPHFAYTAVTLLFVLLILANTRMVIQTYDLDDYQVKDQVYGGLSLGEGKRLAAFIAESDQASGSKNGRVVVYPFEFERSLEYLLGPYNLRIEEIEEDQSRLALRYLITENDKTEAARKKLACCYAVLQEEHIGRFTITALVSKEDLGVCKIGFITDIHATRSKEAPFIGFGSYEPLLAFMDTMEKKFQPDVLIENGDFIDGSETSNARALELYQRTKKIYDRLDLPTLHVMGNHETRSGGITTEQWLTFAGQDRTYYSETCKNAEIIVLDGNNDALRESMNEDEHKALEKNYFIPEEQFTWLESTLAAAKDRQKIVFIHEPLFPRAEITRNIKPEKDLRAEDRERLQALFQKHSVAAVVSGHVESLFHSTIGGTEYFILPRCPEECRPRRPLAWFFRRNHRRKRW
jgi:metallophosphoesterase superfamily enzyme